MQKVLNRILNAWYSSIILSTAIPAFYPIDFKPVEVRA